MINKLNTKKEIAEMLNIDTNNLNGLIIKHNIKPNKIIKIKNSNAKRYYYDKETFLKLFPKNYFPYQILDIISLMVNNSKNELNKLNWELNIGKFPECKLICVHSKDNEFRLDEPETFDFRILNKSSDIDKFIRF